MTTAERLRGDWFKVQRKDALQAALELDQRDDTIAQLRAERDALVQQHEYDNQRIASQAGTTNKLYHRVEELSSERDALARERDRLWKLITKHEWSGYTHFENRCPECLMLQNQGHQDDCSWAAALKRETTK